VSNLKNRLTGTTVSRQDLDSLTKIGQYVRDTSWPSKGQFTSSGTMFSTQISAVYFGSTNLGFCCFKHIFGVHEHGLHEAGVTLKLRVAIARVSRNDHFEIRG
jgi:hypothetical protein